MAIRRPITFFIIASTPFLLTLTLRLWGAPGPREKEYLIAVKLVLFEPNENAPLRGGEEGSWYVPTFLEKYDPMIEGGGGLLGLKGVEGVIDDIALESRLAEMDPNCSFHVVASTAVSAIPGKLVGEYAQSKLIEFDDEGRWVGESQSGTGGLNDLLFDRARYTLYALWFAMIFDRPSPDGWCLAQRLFRLVENNQRGVGEEQPPYYLRVGEATVYLFEAAGEQMKAPPETSRWRPGRFVLLFLGER